jgi:hypothetical protein
MIGRVGRIARAFLAAVAIVAPPPIALAGMCDPAAMPLPERQADEAERGADPALEANCMALVRARVSLVGNSLGPPQFAHSPTWGDVVRIDLGEPSPIRYSRIVCFKRPTDVAVLMGLYDLTKDACQRQGAAVVIDPRGSR